MLKIVIDTNIMISGLGWKGTPYKILDLIKFEKIRLCVSEEIISEYLEVAARGFLPAEAISILSSILQENKFELVEPKQRFTVIKEDPDDNIFLDCGVKAKVKYIVSGDKHLLNLEKFKKIEILSSNIFLKKYNKNK